MCPWVTSRVEYTACRVPPLDSVLPRTQVKGGNDSNILRTFTWLVYLSGRGSARAENAQGTPTQISPSIPEFTKSTLQFHADLQIVLEEQGKDAGWRGKAPRGARVSARHRPSSNLKSTP